MEELKAMKKQLMGFIRGHMGDLSNLDTQELGGAIDMIKDLAEAEYYCTVVKAMEENKKEEKHNQSQPMYYGGGYFPNSYVNSYMPEREMEHYYGKMYYGGTTGGTSGGSANMRERDSQGRFVLYQGQGGNGGQSNAGVTTNGTTQGGNNGGTNVTRMMYSEPTRPMLHYGEDMMIMPERDYREGRSPMTRKYYMEAKEMKKGKAVELKELEKYMHELSEDITEMIAEASPEEKALLQQKLNTLSAKIKN